MGIHHALGNAKQVNHTVQRPKKSGVFIKPVGCIQMANPLFRESALQNLSSLGQLDHTPAAPFASDLNFVSRVMAQVRMAPCLRALNRRVPSII